MEVQVHERHRKQLALASLSKIPPFMLRSDCSGHDHGGWFARYSIIYGDYIGGEKRKIRDHDL